MTGYQCLQASLPTGSLALLKSSVKHVEAAPSPLFLAKRKRDEDVASTARPWFSTEPRTFKSLLQPPRAFVGISEQAFAQDDNSPQRTVCRTGSAYYNPPRCFACSIVS
jgi:hypothetical protein